MKTPSQTKPISPAALIQTIQVNLLHRPLWNSETVQDCLDISRMKLMAMIESGEFPWAFNVGQGHRHAEPRVLALSVVEHQTGPIPAIGATRNLTLPAVFDLILPKRDLRSTELKRLLHCGNDWFHDAKADFVVTKKPAAKGGPNSYAVVSRASVEKWLSNRRMV